MKKISVMKFLTVLCLSVILFGCSKKETKSVFKTAINNQGYYLEVEYVYYAKGDKIQSFSSVTTTDFTKSEKTKADFEADDNKQKLDDLMKSPAVKRYERIFIGEDTMIVEMELDYSKENLVELKNIGLIQSPDGKTPKFVSLKATRKALLAGGFEEVEVVDLSK